MRSYTRMCCLVVTLLLAVSSFTHAATPIKSMVVFGDSLSDTGNVTFLLKSLRQEESPSYLVRPFKIFVINKMIDFAADHYVPQVVLDSGISIVTHFFDVDFAPLLATIVTKIRSIPVLPGEPYWQSRFSNGPVWNEYLTTMLGVDSRDTSKYSNQAFGGSWTMTYDHQLTVWNVIRHPIDTVKTLVVGKLIPPSLGITVQAYLMVHPQLDKDTVYFLLSGGNDFLNVLRFEDNYNPAVMSDYIDNMLESTTVIVKKLRAAGARQIIVLNLPRVGEAPKFVRTSDRDVLNRAVDIYNQRLKERVLQWQMDESDMTYVHIDIQSVLSEALAQPEVFGLTNVKDACIDVKFDMLHVINGSPFAGNYVLEYLQILHAHDPAFAENEKNYTLCDTPDTYLFWDEVHPTTRAHYFLAQAVCEQLQMHGYRSDCTVASKS